MCGDFTSCGETGACVGLAGAAVLVSGDGGAVSFLLVHLREDYSGKEHASCWDAPCAEIPALLRAGPAGERALLALTSLWWLCLSF